MEGSPLGSRHPDEQEFNLREWHFRARSSRENPKSRRYSASFIHTITEDSRSFRSNFTISSTASSPGYHLKDEINPSTYSFNAALKALQTKSGYAWDTLTQEGFALNSKWDEAERYISNPLSGVVPMECLSTKTLNGLSLRSYLANKVTAKPRKINQNTTKLQNSMVAKCPAQEEKMGSGTRSVVNQSFPVEGEGGSSSLSPTSTPSIQERSIRQSEETEDGDTQSSNLSSNMLKPLDEVKVKEASEVEETKETQEAEKTTKKMKKTRKLCNVCNCIQMIGCLSSSPSRRSL